MLPGPRADAPEPLAQAASLEQEADAALQQEHFGVAEQLLKRSLALIEGGLGANDPSLARSLGHLADLYQLQGRYTEAESVYKQVLEIREKAPGHNRLDLGASLNGLAGLYKAQGRYAEAETLFRRALDIADAAPEVPAEVRATILNNLGLVYQNQGRYPEAEPLYQRGLELAAGARETDRALGPVIRNNLAGLYKEQRRYEEAEALYRKVLETREQGASLLDLAASLNNLASVLDAEARFEEAEPLFDRALQARENALGGNHSDVAQSLNNLAGSYWARGQYAKAEPLLQRALDIRERTLAPDHPETAAALNNLAALYWTEGRAEDALDISRRAIAAIESHLYARAGQSTDAALAEYRKSRLYLANYIGIAYGVMQRHPERQDALAADTLRVAQLAAGSTAAQALSATAARLAGGQDSLATAIRKRQDLGAEWQRLDAEVVKLATRPQLERNTEEETGLRAKLAQTREAITKLDRDVADRFPEYAELIRPQPLTAEAVQNLLGPDEALLLYLITRQETWFWVVRPGHTALFRSDLGSPALGRDIEVLRSVLTPDLAPYPGRQAYSLFEKIVAPGLPQLTGARHLMIVPDGALQSLPFSILLTEKPTRDPTSLEDHRGLAWLARDYAISVLPAVSSLRALRQTARFGSASEPFLGVGNPVLAGDSGSERGAAARLFRGSSAADVRRLPALPETADELRAIGKALGASEHNLLLGEQASEPILRRLPLDRYRVIEFATHGLLAGEIKGLAEPALVLTPPPQPTPDDDGLLTASKIATLKLAADWVVLSACNTATDDGDADNGGWSGLAKGFFYAGARSLLVSHWPVWSKATVALTTGAFEALKKDPSIGRAEALRRAEIAMLDPSNPAEFAHPLAWAPFVLAGEGGAGR